MNINNSMFDVVFILTLLSQACSLSVRIPSSKHRSVVFCHTEDVETVSFRALRSGKGGVEFLFMERKSGLKQQCDVRDSLQQLSYPEALLLIQHWHLIFPSLPAIRPIVSNHVFT